MLWWKEGSWGDSGKRRRQGRKEEQYLFILLLKPKISSLFILHSEGGIGGRVSIDSQKCLGKRSSHVLQLKEQDHNIYFN